MTDYTWPSGVIPFGASFYLQPHTGGSESPFSRQSKTYSLSAPRWVCSFSVRGFNGQQWSSDETGRQMDAFLAKLKGRANRVALFDFRRGNVTPLTNGGANTGDDYMIFTGGEPEVGQYVGGDGRPHIITTVEQITPTHYKATVEPPFVANVAAGTDAYGSSLGIFRLASDDAGSNGAEVGSPTIYNLDFVEDLAGGFTGLDVYVLGSPVVGQTLSVDSAWPSYRWYADGVAISGAYGSTFVPTTAEVGKLITVVVAGGAVTSHPAGPVVNNILVIAHGNSLTFGPNGTASYPIMMRGMLADQYKVVNLGHSGQTTQQLTDELATPDFATYAAEPAVERILVMFECRNDMVVNGITPAQAVDNLEAYCNAIPSGFSRIYVCTTSADASGDANFTPTDWTDVNALIRARYLDFADELIDIAADSRFQNANDTTYYQGDKLHFTNAGNEALAEIVKAAIAPSSVGAGAAFTPASAAAASVALYGDNRTATKESGGAWTSVLGDQSHSTGKYYFELYEAEIGTDDSYMIGVGEAGASPAIYLGGSAKGAGFSGGGSVFVNGFTAGSSHAAFDYISGSTALTGMVLQLAIDFNAGKIWTGNNGRFFGDPVSGTGPAATFTPGLTLVPGMSVFDPGAGSWELLTTGQRLYYNPPSGFLAWGGGVARSSVTTWRASDAAAGHFDLALGGTVASKANVSWATIRASTPRLTGKLVFEVQCTLPGTEPYFMVGLANIAFVGAVSYLGTGAMSLGMGSNGTSYVSNFTGSTTVVGDGDGAVIGETYSVAVDLGAGKVWVAKNGVWSGDPGAGTGASFTFTPGTALYPAMSMHSIADGAWELHATSSDLVYSLPSGFSAWG